MNFEGNSTAWQPLQFQDPYPEPEFTIGSSFTRSDLPTSRTLKRKRSLAGKALKAFGSLTDRVFIQSRVKTAFSCFPHTDAQGARIKGIAKLYDTVLELSTPGVYSSELRDTARRLVTQQIRTGHTQELVKALVRWNVIELEVFLFGLVEMAILSRNERIPQTTTPEQTSKPTLEQIVLLMARLTQCGPSAYHIVLDANFMDVVVLIKEDALLPRELADIYRALLLIATRPEFQHLAAGMTALNLLARSIASSNDSFMQMYMKWKPEDMSALMEGVLRALTPIWYSRFLIKGASVDSKYMKIEKMREVPPFELRFLQTFLQFWKRIAARNSDGCLLVVRSGYLDFLLSLRETLVNVGQKQDDLDILLHILREQNSTQYTEEEKSQALHVLFFHESLRDMTSELCQKLSSWRPNDYKRMLDLLSSKLRYIVREGAKGTVWKCDQDRIILSVMHFLSRLALHSGDIPCQMVVSAGYLDILRFLQANGFDIRPVIEELNVALQVLRPSNAALAVTDRHRTNALRLILHEICSGNGLYLHPQLEQWTTEDLCGFSKLLVGELNNALKTRPEMLMDSWSWGYKRYFCTFIDQLSALDRDIAQAVVDAGYLGVVLSVHQDSMDVKSAFADFCYTESVKEKDSKPFSFSPCVSQCPSTTDLRASARKSFRSSKAKLEFFRTIRVL